MKRHEEEGHENSERWLLTYSDLITLLMIFFVVMYSMSSVDAKKFEQLKTSMSVAMGGGNIISTVNAGGTGIGTNPPGYDKKSTTKTSGNKPANGKGGTGTTEKQKLTNLKSQIDKYLKGAGLSGDVYTDINERGLILSFRNAVLFDSGSADVKNAFKNQMIMIGKKLSKIDNYIRVEGHTDNVPISNSLYKSNWELSCARAISVSQLLIKYAKIQPSRVAPVGYGEYRPLKSNATVAGRAKNRRVDILIVDNKFKTVENVK